MPLPRIAMLSTMFGFFGFSLYSVESFTSLFMHDAFGLGFLLIGVIFTLSNLSGSAFQIYTGRLGDRIGHRPVLILAYSVASVSLIAMYLVARFYQSLVLFSLLYLLLATSLWSSFPSFGALVSMTGANRVTNFTITRVALNVGTAIGPALAGFLIEGYGYPSIYLSSFIAITLSLATALLFRTKPEEKPPSLETEQKVSPFSFRNVNRTILLLSLSSLLLTILLAQDSVTLPNYASIVRGLTTAQIGLVFTSNGILVVLMQYPVTRIIRRIGVARGYFIGLLLFSIGVFSFSLDSSLPQFIISEAIMTMGEDFGDPSGQAIVSGISEENRIGENMGVYNSFNAVGYSIGPLIGGAIISLTFNPYLIWGTVSLPGFIAVVVYLAMVIRRVGPEMKKRERIASSGRTKT